MRGRLNYVILIFFLIIEIACNNNSSDNKRNYYKSSAINKIDKLLIDNMNNAYNIDDYAKALEYLKELINIDSTNGEYYYKIGYCESGLFNTEESIQAFQKAIDYNYRVVDATFSIGVNYTLVNDSMAKLYFEKCLIEDPSYQRAKIQLLVIEHHKKN